MLTKYIGESQTIQGAALNPQDINNRPEIVLEQNKEYDIDVQLDQFEPKTIVNGQVVISPDSTVWVIFQDKGRIPYSYKLLKNHWLL